MGNICDRNKLCSLLLMANVGITDEMRSLSEIVEGKLYLGSCRAAQDWKVLQQLGITHVINVAASSTWYGQYQHSAWQVVLRKDTKLAERRSEKREGDRRRESDR